MNIQKLEAVLEDMRAATTAGGASPAAQVLSWAERIGEAVTEHLVAELARESTNLATTSELATDPGGHDWDQRRP